MHPCSRGIAGRGKAGTYGLNQDRYCPNRSCSELSLSRTVARRATIDSSENIDIGADYDWASAKNYPGVIVVVDPADYTLYWKSSKTILWSWTKEKNYTDSLSARSLIRTAIAQYLDRTRMRFLRDDNRFLKSAGAALRRNPAQRAAFYSDALLGMAITASDLC